MLRHQDQGNLKKKFIWGLLFKGSESMTAMGWSTVLEQ